MDKNFEKILRSKILQTEQHMAPADGAERVWEKVAQELHPGKKQFLFRKYTGHAAAMVVGLVLGILLWQLFFNVKTAEQPAATADIAPPAMVVHPKQDTFFIEKEAGSAAVVTLPQATAKRALPEQSVSGDHPEESKKEAPALPEHREQSPEQQAGLMAGTDQPKPPHKQVLYLEDIHRPAQQTPGNWTRARKFLNIGETEQQPEPAYASINEAIKTIFK